MLRLTVFNVGQASSALLDFGKGRLGIIDCGVGLTGANPLVERVKSVIAGNANAEISFVILSHLDWDHINGIGDLIREEKIRKRIRRLCCNGSDFRLLLEIVRAGVKA